MCCWICAGAGLTVRDLVRALEQAVIDLLAELRHRGRSAAKMRPASTSQGAKVAALGLRIRRGCSYHGLSLNVDMDLAPFRAIDPCGYPDLASHPVARSGHRRADRNASASCWSSKLDTADLATLTENTVMSDLTEGQTGSAKTARNPVKVIPITPLKKPDWIRVKAGNSQAFYEVKRRLREHNLHTVCEEASCPNIGECFGKGTATFMILGDLCTRRCPFCDVAHGRPKPPDAEEPLNLGAHHRRDGAASTS